MKRFVASFLLVAAVFAVASVAVVAALAVSSTPAEAAFCRCPNIVAPVVCSNGKTYVNLCYAQCDKAKDCVRTEF